METAAVVAADVAEAHVSPPARDAQVALTAEMRSVAALVVGSLAQASLRVTAASHPAAWEVVVAPSSLGPHCVEPLAGVADVETVPVDQELSHVLAAPLLVLGGGDCLCLGAAEP